MKTEKPLLKAYTFKIPFLIFVLLGENDQWILEPFICPLYINTCVPTTGMYVPVSRLSLLNRQISFTELNASAKIGIFVAF